MTPTREIAVGTLGTGKTTFLLTKALLSHEKIFVFDAKNDISLNDFPDAEILKVRHPRVLVIETMGVGDFRKYYDKFSTFILRFDTLDLSDYAEAMNFIWEIARQRRDNIAVFLDEAEIFNAKDFRKQMNWLSTKSRSRNISVYATATRLPYVDRALRDNTTDYYVFYTTSEATTKELQELSGNNKLKEIILNLKKYEYFHLCLKPKEKEVQNVSDSG